MCLDGDCNNDGDYDNDQAAKAVEPGLLVSCPSAGADSLPQDWAKIRLLGHSADVSAGLAWLHAAVSSTGGQIRVWSDRSTNSTLLIDSVAGTSDYSWPLSTTQPLGSLPEWLYVEGVSNSASSGDVTLQACYGSSAGTTSAVDRLVISVMQLSLRIDSCNTNGVTVPQPDPYADSIKALGGSTNYPGKIIFMNDMDVDGDGIPDFLDGFELPDGTTPVANTTEQSKIITGGVFVPVVLSCHVPHTEKAFITFNYNANDPGKLTQKTAEQAVAIANAAPQQNSMPNGGYLRLWTKDASQHRNAKSVKDGGDFVPSYIPIPLANIMTNGQGDVILYAEGIGVTPQWGMEPIKVLVTPDPTPGKEAVSIKDTVTYSVVRCVFKILNWRPYTCVRHWPGPDAERYVFHANYDSPAGLYQSYIQGELGFDYCAINGRATHGLGAFMGHTFVRIESRLPNGETYNHWIGQTGENGKQQLYGYWDLENGKVWWFRASDGARNDEPFLADKFNYYFEQDMGPHIKSNAQSNVEMKQVALREFRVRPETYKLLVEYTDKVHDFSGYGLDVIIDRTDPNSQSSGVQTRCGCGSFVGLLCQYANVCSNNEWRVDHPMIDLPITPLNWTAFNLVSAIDRYSSMSSSLGHGNFIHYPCGNWQPLEDFLTGIQGPVASFFVSENAKGMPQNFLNNWGVTNTECNLLKMMYSDPALISDWIDRTNATTTAWASNLGYTDRGTTILYNETKRGDIREWKHDDPLKFPYQK